MGGNASVDSVSDFHRILSNGNATIYLLDRRILPDGLQYGTSLWGMERRAPNIECSGTRNDCLSYINDKLNAGDYYRGHESGSLSVGVDKCPETAPLHLYDCVLDVSGGDPPKLLLIFFLFHICRRISIVLLNKTERINSWGKYYCSFY